jgi:RNA polymerase sigma factor (sigma-70 family)
LFKVATNLVRDDAKVSSRRLVLLQADPASVPLATPTPEPDHQIETSERARAVREVLDSLSEKDRVILLMQQEGFSHREIADTIGTTTGSVGTMLARALKRFREAAAGRFESMR